MSRLTRVFAGLAVAVLLTGFTPPDPDSFTEGELAASIATLQRNVDEVETTGRQGADEVITLASDILFAFGKASLSEPAERRIVRLARELPRRARVSVSGHTDSIGPSAANRRLSSARAGAVAVVLARVRPDLRLEVRGFGETRPVAPNTSGGIDNPDGRAKNRRVEVRFRA